MQIDDRLQPTWVDHAPVDMSSDRSRLLRRLDGVMLVVAAVAGSGLAAVATYAVVSPRSSPVVASAADPHPPVHALASGSGVAREQQGTPKHDKLAVAAHGKSRGLSADVAVETDLVSTGSSSPIPVAALMAAATSLSEGTSSVRPQVLKSVAFNAAPTAWAEGKSSPKGSPGLPPNLPFKPSSRADQAFRVAQADRSPPTRPDDVRLSPPPAPALPGSDIAPARQSAEGLAIAAHPAASPIPLPKADRASRVAQADRAPFTRLDDDVRLRPSPPTPTDVEPARVVAEAPDVVAAHTTASRGDPPPSHAAGLVAAEATVARSPDPGSTMPASDLARASTAMVAVTSEPPARPGPSLLEAHQAAPASPAAHVSDPHAPAPSGAGQPSADAGAAATARPGDIMASLEIPAPPLRLPAPPLALPLLASQSRPRIVVVRPMGASAASTRLVKALATTAGWTVAGVRYVPEPIPNLAFKSPSSTASVMTMKNRLATALHVPRDQASLSITPISVAEVWVPDTIGSHEPRPSPQPPAPDFVPAPAPTAPVATTTGPAAGLPSILRPSPGGGDL